MDTNLKKLVAAIRDAEQLVGLDLETWNPRTRPGMEIRRNQAAASLDGLYDQFGAEYRRSALAVFVIGPEAAQAEFAAIAADIANAAVVSAMALYIDATRDAAATMGTSGRFGPTEVAHVMGALRTIMHATLKLPEFMRPDFGAMFLKFVSPTDLVTDIQAAVVKGNGHGLAAMYLSRIAAKQALALGETSTVVVTGVSNRAEFEALSQSGQFTSKSIVVSLEDVKVNQEYVRALLTQAGVAVIEPAAPATEQSPSQVQDPVTEQSPSQPATGTKKTTKKKKS